MDRRLTPTGDDGAMGLVTLGRLVVILGIVGVFGYDGFAVMSNNVSTENDAQTAAYAASSAWHSDNENINLAYQAAVQSLAGKDDTVLTTGFTVDSEGLVHLEVRHTTHTVVFSRIGPLKHLAVATQHGDANSVN